MEFAIDRDFVVLSLCHMVAVDRADFTTIIVPFGEIRPTEG
jgi:hypothetical protein